MKPKVLIFASGSKEGGGSGFLHLILNMLSGLLPVEICGVVCNYENGGVRKIADQYGIWFSHLASFTAEDYFRVAAESGAEWFLLSGWLKHVKGLPANRTINIHPGPTQGFGGKGYHGHHVHQAILDAGAKETAVTMHFVTENFDEGPTFFEYPLRVCAGDDADSLGSRVNRYEHGHQSWITSLVISGQIAWDGNREHEVQVPDWYRTLPFCPKRLQVAA